MIRRLLPLPHFFTILETHTMRHSRLLFMPLALLALAACHDDGVSVNARPPLGGVRFVNAVPDGGPVDIRYVDQVNWSGSSVNGTSLGLAFRAGTIHWATEAKARHIRVFPTDSSLAVTTQVLIDTTINVEANKNVTLMLVGSRAAGKIGFIQINDDPAPTATQVGIRLVNATSAAADAYLTTDTTSALPAAATFAAVPPLSASPYLYRNTGKFFARILPPASTTPLSFVAPAGAPADGLVGVTAGYNGPGSALSAYLFPASVTGTKAPQTAAYKNPAIVYFVDLVPAPPQ
jgi:hypothetical protein